MGNEQNANVYSGTGNPAPPNYQPQVYPQVYPQVQPQVYPHVNPQVHPHVHPQIHVMQPTAGPLPMGEVYVMPQLGSDPQQLKCPTCRSMITTRVEYESYLTTHLIAGGLCLVGCFFLFCWFCAPCPYCKFLFLSFYSIGFGVAKNVFFRHVIVQKGESQLSQVQRLYWFQQILKRKRSAQLEFVTKNMKKINIQK